MISDELPAALDGERLDRVVSLIADVSRSDAAAVIAAGGVLVDGVTATAGKVRLHAGQVVSIDPAALPVDEPPAADPSVVVRRVYEDGDVVVIDKPAGLVVHPAHGHMTGTLVNGLLALYPEIAGVGDPARPGIVHRLDVGTSGLMVVARSQDAYDALVAELAAREVTRLYDALVWGHPEAHTGVIDAPIGRDQRDPLRMAVVVDGRPARTRYEVVEALRPADAPPVALLRCRLETGRTHQIRVHLAAVGHPVVGDATYGGVRDGIDAPRPFLHAAHLSFTHPSTGEPIEASAPLPDDLTALLAGLRPSD